MIVCTGCKTTYPDLPLPLYCSCGHVVREQIGDFHTVRADHLELLRLSICHTCDQYADRTCKMCGCADRFRHSRLRRAWGKCPKGLWEKPRIGLFTPGTGSGGAERWVGMLARELATEFPVTGVAVYTHGRGNPTIERSIEQTCPIYRGPSAAHEVPCDIMISWGMFPATNDPIHVHVSHSAERADCHLRAELAGAELVAVSEAAGVFRKPATVLYNGIETKRLVQSQTDLWPEITKRYQTVILHLGRCSPEKNYLTAARVANAMDGTAIVLYVGDDSKLDEIRAVSEHTAFVAYVENLGDIMAACSVLLSASRTEAHSLALCEAWYAGLPVVATRVGAVPELEERFGRLVEPIDDTMSPAQIANAIVAAKQNRKIAIEARSVARQLFTEQAFRQRWATYLNGVWENANHHRPTGLRATRRQRPA